MRLLHTTELVLKEFFDNSIPKYAILSHRWQKEEVSLQDFVAIRNLAKPEYQKFEDFLRLSMSASENSLGYVKILMCYVSLNGDILRDQLDETEKNQLRASKWFSRGWTLQELIAPRNVIFFDRNWSTISTRSAISDLLADITQIPEPILTRERHLKHYSVAQKMSWAARRETSRIEDTAYCLLVIFDVNMPLLYGEGLRAFERLQEEIIKVSDDYSIFLWPDTKTDVHSSIGLLAPSPDYFTGCDVGSLKNDATQTRPYRTTNRGLEWDVRLFNVTHEISKLLRSRLTKSRWTKDIMYLLPMPADHRYVLVLRREQGKGPVKDYQTFSRLLLMFDQERWLTPGRYWDALPPPFRSDKSSWTILLRLHCTWYFDVHA